MNKALKITGRVLALILVLLAAALVALQSSKVQTALGKRIVRQIEKDTDATIDFKLVSVRPFDALVLEDVLLLDKQPYVSGMDTILFVKSLTAKFSLRGLLQGSGIHVSRAKLEGGCYNLALEPDPDRPGHIYTNIQRALRMSHGGGDIDFSWGNILTAKELQIKNLRFWMENPGSAARMEAAGGGYGPGVIDWNHFRARLVEAWVKGLDISDSYIRMEPEKLEIQELDQGFHVHASAEKLRVGREQVRIDDLHLRDDKNTNLHARYFEMNGHLDDYEFFEDKIQLRAQFLPGSVLSMRTTRYFSSDVGDISFRGALNGKFDGYVSDFKLDHMTVQDLDSDWRLNVSGGMVGLPDAEQSLLDFQVHEMDFSLKDLGTFVEAWAPGTGLDLSDVASGERFRFSGNVKGPMNRMQVTGGIGSGIGSVQADVTLRNVIDNDRPILIGGALQTRDLDLGKLTGVAELGPMSMVSGLEASFRDEGMEVRLDSLNISRLRALDYDYTGISAVGTYREDAFDGRIIAADPNLNFIFQGLFNLSGNTRNAAYRFYASLGYADLHALHLDSREQSKVSFQASSNFLRTENRDLLGEIVLSDLTLESSTGRHDIGNLTIRAHANDNLHRIQLRSHALDATFVGDRSLNGFVNDLQYLLLEKELPALLTEHITPWEGATYNLSAKVYQAQDLLNFLMPGLYVENKTEAALKVDAEGLVTASLQSGRLAYSGKYAKDFRLDFNNAGGVLSAEGYSSEISLSGASLRDNHITLFADDNHFGAGFSFDNGDEEKTRAELYLSGELARGNGGLEVTGSVLPSNFYYEDSGWALSSGEIRYRNGDWHVERLAARHEDEALWVDGGLSDKQKDTLAIRMEKFDLALLNTLTGGVPSVEGLATGQALILSPSQSSLGLLASIQCDSTRVSGRRLGQLQLNSFWDEPNKRFSLKAVNSLDGRTSVRADGYFVPSSEKLHLVATLKEADMGYAEPFMEGLFSTFAGKLSGQVQMDGPFDKLALRGHDLKVADGLLALEFTGVPYQVQGELGLDNRGLHFRDLQLSDGENGTGTVSGSVLFKDFSNFKLDTHVQLQDMRVVDLPKGANDLLWGKVYGTGRADVTGPLSRILLDIDARTTRDGELHIPLDSESSDRNDQLLTFTAVQEETEVDPYEVMMAANAREEARGSDLNVKLRVRATPEVRLYIDIDDENSLNASGSGTIDLESREAQGSFTMNGNYTLRDGSFHFSALNLVSRDFTIQEGSSVRFNGDVWDTELNVNGLYVTKASLANLIADETAVNRRTVNCGINITGPLRNPEVDFSIDVPDLNPAVQAQVEGALNSSDKVQKQFIYLLVAGNFLPAEESGITTSGSDVLFSNVSSIMSGQINNIFQKLDIPLDLGLNYQATQTGNNIFDVALSTQLFNNRVLVNGTVGNKQLYGGTTTNEVAGDVDIEIKLNRSGTLRLNLFTHSADQLTSYLDNSQRHGGGIAWQREFNSLGQFFRSLFSSRKEREEWMRNLALNPPKAEVLQIDSTGKAHPYEPE